MLYAFYSYKGGVGRSMALANLGELFHEKGLRTLLIDWDLEAPGLELYFYPDQASIDSRGHLGLIDMLVNYKDRFRRFATSPADAAFSAEEAREYREFLSKRNDVPRFSRDAEQPPATFEEVLTGLSRPSSPQRRELPAALAASPFRDYVQCLRPPDPRENGLFLLSAGRRSHEEFSNYAAAVKDFDWAEFYAAYNGREYFNWFRDRLREIADVVLIDSRTGVTEMVCTRHLPDAVLSFCAPNFQNVDGIARVVSGVNGDVVKEARGGRDIQVLVVPARIDYAESDRLGNFAALFAEKLEKDEFMPAALQGLDRPMWNLQIPYSPRYSYREELAIGPSVTSRDPVTQKLVEAYQRIAVHLAVLADDGERVKNAFAAEIAIAFPHLSKGARQMAPPVSDGWVERPKEAEALKHLLTERQHSLQSRVAVWGFPGTGKTSLTAHGKLSPDDTRTKRREFERKAAEACAEVAHVLIIDYLRGWNKATKKNIRLAKKALRKAYDLDPTVALAHLADGKIREVEGDLNGEVEALNEALAIDKDLLDAHAHLANAHILLGDAKEALAVLSKAPPPSRGDPELGLFDWFKGRAYFHLKDYDQAIYWLQKSVDVRPTTWFSWAHLISAYALKKDLSAAGARLALEKYRKCFLKNWPLDPKIRNYYKQPKYNGAYPELQAALKELINGLEISHRTEHVP